MCQLISGIVDIDTLEIIVQPGVHSHSELAQALVAEGRLLYDSLVPFEFDVTLMDAGFDEMLIDFSIPVPKRAERAIKKWRDALTAEDLAMLIGGRAFSLQVNFLFRDGTTEFQLVDQAINWAKVMVEEVLDSVDKARRSLNKPSHPMEEDELSIIETNIIEYANRHVTWIFLKQWAHAESRIRPWNER